MDSYSLEFHLVETGAIPPTTKATQTKENTTMALYYDYI
jgi:hypothetical protein